MPADLRAAALCVVASVAAACGTTLPPRDELILAEREIASGATARGAARMEAAFEALDERDPLQWDRLGEIAAAADPDVAARAFDRAESLLWPDAGPRNTVALALPFEGRWRVTQGNRGEFSHRRLADRFAWDFQMVDGRGRANRGDGDAPASFFGFGAPVLAPADGVVELAEDGVPDNADGERNRERPAGNVVVVRHGPGELSRFCHLQCGTVAVRVGETVRRGEMIGRCGCSGNAIEPHLHYVLRVGPTSEDFSIPARFEGAAGVPQEGDVVGPR